MLIERYFITHNMAVLLNMYLIRICVLYILLLGRVVQNVNLVKLVDKYHSVFYILLYSMFYVPY